MGLDINNLPQKALSIRQPWAWLIVNGFKDVENRTWKTKYRGPVLVHASKKIDKHAYEWVEWKFGGSIKIPAPEQLDCGGIVGLTTIVDCIEEFSDSRWHALGACGFILKESKPLPFMPCNGRLGFFSIKYNSK
ncbi:ASCH domain-containing protein [Desulfosarcina ovata]|nr:ASCH domain-containing protein [Desulfosarcina ovata]